MPNLEEAEKFEIQQLNGVFVKAMVGAFLHKCTAWLGAGTLTWATAVVMGGFASQVALSDFVSVTFLVIEIAFLLALALFTSKLVTKKSLYRGSLDPVHLCYQDKRLSWIFVIQCVSVFVQLFLFIVPCAYIAISSLRRDEFKPISINGLLFQVLNPGLVNDNTPGRIADLQACFRRCASISVGNTTVSSAASCIQSCFLKPIAIAGDLEGTHLGLVEANEFDAKEFFLQGLGEDLSIRNIAPLEVKKQNSDIVTYLLYHPKGMEMVYEGLASGDTIRQQTAANMVGFWAPRDDQKELQKNSVLLAKLAEKLGLPGKAAEAAANSFSALSFEWHKQDPSPLLRIKVACDGGGSCNVVERVVDLILRRRLPTLQVYVRLLDSFFRSRGVRHSLNPQDMKEVVNKLKDIVDREEKVQSNTKTTDAKDMTIDVTNRASIRARTSFLAFSAMDHLSQDFDIIAALNISSQGTPSRSNTVNLDSPQSTAGNQISDGLISVMPTTSDDKADGRNTCKIATLNTSQETTDTPMNSSQDTTNGTSNGTVKCNASSSTGNNGIADWPTLARELLLELDNKLKNQEFMWQTEADRYRELCYKYLGKEPETLSEPNKRCQIRGEEHTNFK